MEFEYLDIHSHLDFKDFDSDREEEIQKMKEQKIGTTTIGVDFESSQKAIDLAEKHQNLFASVGQHPDDSKDFPDFDERLVALAENPKVVAIGECGLDYFRLPGNSDIMKEVQKEKFERHIDLAVETSKPLMLHIRPSRGSQDAYTDALDMLESHFKKHGTKLRGNSHFFAGDMDALRRFLDIGFTVSFTGVITFARGYDEIIKYVPDDMIMAETDAPFVAPVPYRGARNSPLYVTEVVKKIAEIRNEPFEKVKTTLVNNALRHFKIKD